MSQNAFQNERLGTVEPGLTLINASPFTMLRRWFGILKQHLHANIYGGDPNVPWNLQYLNNPDGIAFDAQGNMYIATMGSIIYKANPITQTVMPFAGTGVNGAGSFASGITFFNSALHQCSGIAIDALGNVYMAQPNENIIVKFDIATGLKTNIVGTVGALGSSGDGGPATSALVTFPPSIIIDTHGCLVFTDANTNKVRVVNLTGVDGTFYGKFITAGNIDTIALLDRPGGVAADPFGNLYVAYDGSAPGIKKVNSAGVVTVYAGNHTAAPYSGDGGQATSAVLRGPGGVATNSAGDVFFFDSSAVHKIDHVTGVITTVAGTSNSPGYSGDGGLATAAQMMGTTNGLLTQLAFDAAGNLFVTDGIPNNTVRRIDAITGIITSTVFLEMVTSVPLPVSGKSVDAVLSLPIAVKVDAAGNLYVCNDGLNAIVKMAPNGDYSVVAGKGSQNYTGDGGQAVDAELSDPEGVAVLLDGSVVYIADSTNDVIRKVDMHTGIITTIAGIPSAYTYGGRGGPATAASFNYVQDVAVDSKGNIYISDSGNNVISKIDVNTGILTDVVGDFGTYGLPGGYAGDGGLATAAGLRYPGGITFDAADNMYFADANNNVVRRVDVITGIITTVAGTGVFGYSGDGGPATSAELAFPYAVAVASDGTFYITNNDNNAIRKVTTNGIITTITTIAGTGVTLPNGGLAIKSLIKFPYGLCVAPNGDIFCSDSVFNLVDRLYLGL